MNKINTTLKEYKSIAKLYESSLQSKNFNKIIKILKRSRKKRIFFCGNGGSAANANHAAVDFNNLPRKGGKLKFSSQSLCANSEMITAIANDFGYEKIFKLQLEDLARSGDILFILSVSGSSKNVYEAAKYCNKKNITVISILGFNGGKIKQISDISISFESKNFALVEDLQMMLIHSICEILKNDIQNNQKITT